MLKTWGELSESRRGWAVGGTFGLLISTLYFFLYGQIRGQFFFHLLTAPGIPGIILSENFTAVMLQHFGQNAQEAVRLPSSVLATATNYFFWGCYCRFLYKNPLVDQKNFAFSLLIFFLSVLGMAYSYSRGVAYDEVSVGLFLLLVSFFLCLISFIGIFSCLLQWLAEDN